MGYSRGKLTKYRVMSKSSVLAAAIPSWRKFSESSFQTFLQRYKRIIVKPSVGSGGAGVIAVSRQDSHKYKIHRNRHVTIRNSIRSAYCYVRKFTREKSHVIQKKIALAKVNGRPFDVRVMIQRDRSGSWVITGKLAKVAGSGYIITNIRRSRGRVIPFTTAIERSNIKGRSASEIAQTIDTISLAAVKQLQKYYSIRTVGLDIGIDNRGRVWIIEPNFHPDITMFRKLKDQSFYRRIVSLKRR